MGTRIIRDSIPDSQTTSPDYTKIISILTAGLVLFLAMGAFYLSYSALRAVAIANGITGTQSYIWPLLVDFALVVFSLSVVRNSLLGEKTRWPWFLVGVFTITTIAFNVLHAPNTIIARAVAVVAPVALFLSFETLMSQFKSEVVRAGTVATLADLKRQTTALTTEHDKLTISIDTLASKRDTVKTELATARKEKQQTFATIGDDTRNKALSILAQRSAITGAELGRELGKSESLGRKLRRELLPLAEANGNHNGKGSL